MSKYMEKGIKKSWFRKLMDRLAGLSFQIPMNRKEKREKS
jgi:hypothetical protein